MNLNAAEESVMDNPDKFNPADLVRLRRYLLSLRKSLFHEREILVKFAGLDSPFITTRLYFIRDIYDHLTNSLN